MLEPGELLSTMDAKVWADEFMETKARLGEKEFDHAMMLGWFANAIMAGFDEATRRQQATIADLQGQLKAAKAPRMYDCGSCAIGKGFEQRVAQLEGEKGTLRLGLNALRDSYDELEGRHSDIQDDHARVLGLVMVAREYIATIPARLHPDHSEEWKDGYQSAVYDVDQFLTGKRAACLPAQPAQGGAKCVWVDDGGDKYATGCNKYLQVYAESEEAPQWVKFCCYCGKPVEHFEAADVEGGA